MAVTSDPSVLQPTLSALPADTECLYTEATQAILQRYGKNFDWEVKTRLMGRSPIEAARILVEATGIPLSPEEFHHELYGSLGEIFPNAKLMPGEQVCCRSLPRCYVSRLLALSTSGAIAMVRHLHANGIPLAVATSSASSSYRQKVSRHDDLFACFGHVVCSDDRELKKSKPAPDIYLLAASRFSIPFRSHSNVSALGHAAA